jgi:uncharacterized membrane protein (UPF0127 family)
MTELPEGKIVRFEEKEFNFSVADNGLSLMRGLGGVTSLEPYDGMLFDFGQDFDIHMWAKNLTFPVDVAFIDVEGVVFQFGRLSPDSEQSFTLKADVPGRYALEVSVGFFEDNGIQIGSKLEL